MNVNERTASAGVQGLWIRLQRIEKFAFAEMVGHRNEHRCAGVACHDYTALSWVWSEAARQLLLAVKAFPTPQPRCAASTCFNDPKSGSTLCSHHHPDPI